ncbi:MAG: 2-oxoglutarate oxidoreductase [Desulfovibrio sp.]|jgi:2-oxoglutarate ferredoxin oxidoreductase subunit beta|nr:2-oxoglutarate oxidoreductase [Desulfovibrio sp.]
MTYANNLHPQQGEKMVFDANPVLNERVTHYCPGCHHGIAHRLVSEVLHELGVADKTILVAAVGCSTFTYDYFNVDSVEAPHGRACAVATGVRRARPEAVVFTYQGDGDMAAIGMAESLHAANRGEKITTVFINNTVYGMTGGQMAPTTLIGQKTTTTRHGRNFSNEGGPIRLTEIMAGLQGVAYAARCALDSVKHVRKAKKAVRLAFDVQLDGLGFGFVELLAGCPTNWHMDPIAANKHIATDMIPIFPLGVFKDVKET